MEKKQVKSKQRVADHGEVFTAERNLGNSPTPPISFCI